MIWFLFVFKLPDPKINKICASKTEKAALLYLKESKLSFFCFLMQQQLTYREKERKNLVFYFIQDIKPHPTILQCFFKFERQHNKMAAGLISSYKAFPHLSWKVLHTGPDLTGKNTNIYKHISQWFQTQNH